MLACGTPTTLATRVQRGADGLTLVDLTIVLGLIVTLALVLTPSIVGVVDESRKVRAQNDCNRLARAIVSFHNDTSQFPESSRTGRQPTGSQTRPVLFVGPGRLPVAGATPGIDGWLIPATASVGNLDGRYLPTVAADPWTNRYAVNAVFLERTDGAQVGAAPNKRAVWVLSAGPNGIIETPFSQPARSAVLGGDDIGTRVQ